MAAGNSCVKELCLSKASRTLDYIKANSEPDSSPAAIRGRGLIVSLVANNYYQNTLVYGVHMIIILVLIQSEPQRY